MRVVKRAEIIGLCRIRRVDLAGLHFELGLAETSAFDEGLICEGDPVSVEVREVSISLVARARHVRIGARSSSSMGFRSSGSCGRSAMMQ